MGGYQCTTCGRRVIGAVCRACAPVLADERARDVARQCVERSIAAWTRGDIGREEIRGRVLAMADASEIDRALVLDVLDVTAIPVVRP